METFNPKNGQIYRETTSSRVSSMVPAWKKHATGRRVNPQVYKNKTKGSSTLRDMAMRSCCWNIELFMPETLVYPGWHYAGMIYRHLKATDTLTFEAWTLFQQAYPHQLELSHHFRVGHLDSVTSWSSIVRNLGMAHSVLTRFCVYGLELDVAHLISLTNIPTLAALIHVHPAQRDSNPLRGFGLRNWCRAVREKEAFQKLELLFLSSISELTNAMVLDELTNFPALRLVGISRHKTGRTESSKIDGRWICPSVIREIKLSKVMRDPQCTITEKTEALYRYAKVSLLEPEADEPATLSMTCVAAEPSLRNENMSWFIRNWASTETQPKRLQEAQDLHAGSEQAPKKRKVRQGKQQDVGFLLEMLG